MTISINDALIKEKELTVAEFLVLLPMYLKVDISKVDKDSLEKRGILRQRYTFNYDTKKLEPINFALMDRGIETIRDILLDSDKTVATVDSLQSLASQMQEIFPKGKKDGTNYYWRGSSPEIIRKLQIFFKRYGDISHTEILDATRKYVESFNDSQKFMQLLKYFIWKDKDDGSQDSMLLSYIENYNEEDTPRNNDWTTNLN